MPFIDRAVRIHCKKKGDSSLKGRSSTVWSTFGATDAQPKVDPPSGHRTPEHQRSVRARNDWIGLGGVSAGARALDHQRSTGAPGRALRHRTPEHAPDLHRDQGIGPTSTRRHLAPHSGRRNAATTRRSSDHAQAEEAPPIQGRRVLDGPDSGDAGPEPDEPAQDAGSGAGGPRRFDARGTRSALVHRGAGAHFFDFAKPIREGDDVLD